MTAAAPKLSVRVRHEQGTFVLDAALESNANLLAIFGPSGAGKTTLLNIIGGLVRPRQAHVAVAGRVLNDTETGIFVPPHRRRIGIVFQDSQLFPHLSVEQNIKFGGWFNSRGASSLTLDAVIDTLGIAHVMQRRPAGLSGGEKQRVALARALMASPSLLLMDEPLAGLDDDRRGEILALIERVRDEFKVPIVYVTHRRDEVERLAREIVYIDRGRTRGIERRGALQD